MLDAGTGEPLWRVAADHWIPSSPAVTSDLVSFGSEGGLLYPLNVVTAELDWRLDEAEAIFSNPVIADGVLFCSDGAGVLCALKGDPSLAGTPASS